MATADGARGAPPDLDALLARVERHDISASHCLNAGRNGVYCDAVHPSQDGRFVRYEDFDALAAACRALRADAARYQWLKEKDDGTLCAIAWRVPAACKFGEADAAIDAARGA